jgi:ABC-type multidrug transport system fused ATPase/permease subunit
MTGIAAADRMLEYRLATDEKRRLKGHQLVWFMLKRGAVSLHWYLTAILVALVDVAVEFLRPIPSAIIVGSILPLVVNLDESSSALITVCLIWAVLEVVRVAVVMVYTYLSTEGSFNLMYDLRRRFLGDMEEMNEESKESLGLGRLYTTYSSDLPAYSQFYSDFLPSLITNLINIVATFGVIYFMSPAIFTLLLLVVPLQMMVMSFFRSRIRSNRQKHSRLRDTAMSMFNESLANADLIKSFDAVERMSGRTLATVEGMIDQQRKQRNYRNTWIACSNAVSIVFTVGIAVIAGLQVIEGAISLTLYIVLNAYAQRVINPIMAVIQSWQDIIPLMVSVQWSEEFFDKAGGTGPRTHTKQMPITNHDIEFREVTFRYPDTPDTSDSARPALEDISFRAPHGQMTVLCGASGCGKSTVLKLLRGNLETREGRVLLGGTDVREIDRKNLSLLMAYLSQKISLLSMSILQNAELLSPKSTEEDLQHALRMANVLDEIEAMEQEVRVSAYDARTGPVQQIGRMLFGFEPRRVELMERREGLDRMAGLSGNLSGGQQQRVSIGFSLLTQCPILLFDEPTSGLDKFSENKLVDTISGLAERDRTVVVVAHTLAPYFALPDDKVFFVFLHNGRLIGAGQRRQLLRTCPEFRALARENIRHVIALQNPDLELMNMGED